MEYGMLLLIVGAVAMVFKNRKTRHAILNTVDDIYTSINDYFK